LRQLDFSFKADSSRHCKRFFYTLNVAQSNQGGKLEGHIEEIKRKILPILKRHNATKAGLFGSLIRGEMGEDSDIDVLVEIGDDISLLDFVGIKLEIEEALGRRVDLVEYCTIKPLLKDRILSEQVEIL
jgi:hypothetical protein